MNLARPISPLRNVEHEHFGVGLIATDGDCLLAGQSRGIAARESVPVDRRRAVPWTHALRPFATRNPLPDFGTRPISAGVWWIFSVPFPPSEEASAAPGFSLRSELLIARLQAILRRLDPDLQKWTGSLALPLNRCDDAVPARCAAGRWRSGDLALPMLSLWASAPSSAGRIPLSCRTSQSRCRDLRDLRITRSGQSPFAWDRNGSRIEGDGCSASRLAWRVHRSSNRNHGFLLCRRFLFGQRRRGLRPAPQVLRSLPGGPGGGRSARRLHARSTVPAGIAAMPIISSSSRKCFRTRHPPVRETRSESPPPCRGRPPGTALRARAARSSRWRSSIPPGSCRYTPAKQSRSRRYGAPVP